MSFKKLDLFRGITISSDHKDPLYLQIYNEIRNAILKGRFKAGIRLPSPRLLSKIWSVSRSTVLLAFEHLIVEGYIETKPKSGTFVCQHIPDKYIEVQSENAVDDDLSEVKIKYSNQFEFINKRFREHRKLVDIPVPFRPGIPDKNVFPISKWRNASNSIYRTGLLESTKLPLGYSPLKENLKEYLTVIHGISCKTEQIVLVSSTQQALSIICDILLNSNDGVVIEDPGYIRVQSALYNAGVQVHPVPVDKEGLQIPSKNEFKKPPKLIYTTPSHQYPLGINMSLKRRFELLEYAKEANAIILEDDYISEFRYSGVPKTPLYGLDTGNRVIFMGTFSKLFSPALKLSYLVVPERLIEGFETVMSMIHRGPSIHDQATMSLFISNGNFQKHIRKVRKLYSEKRNYIIALLKKSLKGHIEIQKNNAGLHIIGWLPEGVSDLEVSRFMAENNIVVPALSSYTLKSIGNKGALLFGFTGWDIMTIEHKIEKFCLLYKEFLKGR